LPSYLAGINIKIGGRLPLQRITPKKTLITVQKGATSRGKVDYVD
jgi:hypothetical protein